MLEANVREIQASKSGAHCLDCPIQNARPRGKMGEDQQPIGAIPIIKRTGRELVVTEEESLIIGPMLIHQKIRTERTRLESLIIFSDKN